MKFAARWLLTAYLALWAVMADGAPELRHENFDRDPAWDGYNNRQAIPREVKQDFGWSQDSNHAGGKAPGVIGGHVSPAGEPAFYAVKLERKTLDDPLSASGTLYVEPGVATHPGSGHILVGFFNDQTINEWRTPNTIALRIFLQSADTFHCHLDYLTGKWRNGSGLIGTYDEKFGKHVPKELLCGQVYHWTLTYDPDGNDGAGLITVTLDGETTTAEYRPEHRADGAEFNRFGILNVMKHHEPGNAIWLDDITVNGEEYDFTEEPQWDGLGNRRTYLTTDIRPHFDFGYSPTNHAGGEAQGELGGLIFRGDCRYPQTLACYGDQLSTLTLERPLRASGKVVLKRGVTDSAGMIGFFNREHSMWMNPSQDNRIPLDSLGITIEGPSREGFYFYPFYRTHGDATGTERSPTTPRIYPDGKSHDWTLEYDPAGAGGNGRITVTLDGQATSLDLEPGHKAVGAQFNRFGMFTPWVDGNAVVVYYDDLTYTSSH